VIKSSATFAIFALGVLFMALASSFLEWRRR